MEHKSRLQWAVEGLNFCLVLMITVNAVKATAGGGGSLVTLCV